MSRDQQEGEHAITDMFWAITYNARLNEETLQTGSGELRRRNPQSLARHPAPDSVVHCLPTHTTGRHHLAEPSPDTLW